MRLPWTRSEKEDHAGTDLHIIAGLGNPGKQYDNTRHNTGFDVVDELIERSRIPLGGVRFHSVYGKGKLAGTQAVLMKPLSYMNLSGEPISRVLSYFKADPVRDLIVVCDDIDLPVGRIRIRRGGSAGGHNGLKNIIAMLGTDQFVRVRVGVGQKPAGWDLADYVLGHFDAQDRVIMDEAVKRAADAVEMILSDGVDAAMNQFNRRSASE